MKTLASAFFIMFSTSQLQAVEEDQLAAVYKTEVLPYFKSQAKRHFKRLRFLINKKHIFSFYHIKKNSNKLLVVLPGRGEAAEKYIELAYDLKDVDTDIMIIDHLGQGSSQRFTRDIQKGHISNFKKYVKAVQEAVVALKPRYESYNLLTHSMGGAIGLSLLQELPSFFDKAFMVAPMFGFNTGPFSQWQALQLSRTLTYTGQGKNYAPGKGPFKFSEFDKQKGTHSKIRHKLYQDNLKANRFIRLGGPTNEWVYESLKETIMFKQVSGFATNTEITVFQAEKEVIVLNSAQNTICEKLNSCELIFVEGAYHSVLQEKDEMRTPVIEKIINEL